jgi:putative DNA primase/helicase
MNVARPDSIGKGLHHMLSVISSSSSTHFIKAADFSRTFGQLPPTPAAIALGYVRRGWNPVPLPYKTKKPVDEGWQHRVIRDVDVPKHFNGQPQNIGVILGATSGGLTDIDLDCREAVELASWVLPKTPAIFGRASNRASHWLYRTKLYDAAYGAEVKLQDPKRRADKADKIVILEVRVGGKNADGEVKGAQSVFPGSVHETGEEIKWEEAGEPAEVDGDDLMRKGRLLASCCLLARYWPGKGVRHDAALTLGGFFARAGFEPAYAKHLVEAVARAAGDEEYRDRVKAAEDAAAAHHEGARAYGLPNLKEIFGERVGEKVAEWLSYKEAAAQANPSHGLNTDDLVTEDSAAEGFVELHGDGLRYCHTRGSWFCWNGARWVPDETARAFHYARQLARGLARIQDERRQYITSKVSFASGVERFARSDPRIAVTAKDWDCDPWVLGTPDGTIDLRTGTLRTSARADGITKTTSVGPETAGCPLWLRFLDEATGGDQELIRFLQQWTGYCLTGVTREHALLFVYGGGGNGKSVFLNTVLSILGDYATASAMETFTASNNDKHPTDLAMLAGARLVTASETEEGKAWAESRIKQMTGGDPITARFMRQDFFTYMPQFKLTVIGNHKPTLRNVDEAARRRFNIVPFTRKPANPDPRLGERLMAEAGAILQWMIDGCLDWQDNGLVRPACVISATEEYFSDQEVFPRWLEEECISDPNSTVSEKGSILYKSWADYAKSVGASPGKLVEFREKMERAGFRYRRTTKVREFVGVRLKPQGV